MIDKSVILEQAEQASQRAEEYTSSYVGPGLWYKVRRTLKYRCVYISYMLARAFGYQKEVSAKNFFGKQMHVYLNDGDGFLLRTFGCLVAEENYLTKYLIKNLTPTDIFYDIGANYGFYSLLAVELCSEGEVHAFEPLPDIYRLTKKTLAPYANAQLLQSAVSDTSGTAELFSFTDSGISGISSLENDSYQHVHAESKKIIVDTTTFDIYVSTHTPPTFCKIDVEGAEYLVVAGGLETFKKYRPTISLEVWGKDRTSKHTEALMSLLELSYVLYSLTKEGELEVISDVDEYLDTVEGFANIILVPNEKHK